MSQRNLTDLFYMLRNNAYHNKNIYSDTIRISTTTHNCVVVFSVSYSSQVRDTEDDHTVVVEIRICKDYKSNSDNVALLDRGSGESSSYMEQPNWMRKYEDIAYVLKKIETKIDELEQIQGSTARSVLKENFDNTRKVQKHAEDISRLISTTYGDIKTAKSFTRSQNRQEAVLLQNLEKKLLMTLQSTSERFQKAQTVFNDNLNNIQQNSQLFYDKISANIDSKSSNSVDTFDNFLNMNVSSGDMGDKEDDKLDDYFQLPATGLSINQKQLMIIEADNTKMIQSREQEVSKIVNSIEDLNIVFKDLSQIIQEQGTILDRIDYNVECTQTKVFEGYQQLQKADKYQRKNKRMHCILILASMIMFMIILTIFTKF